MTAVDFIRFLTVYIGKKQRSVFIATAVNGLCLTALMYSLQVGITGLEQAGGVSIRGFLLFACSITAYYLTQLFAIRTSTDAAFAAVEDLELRLINKLRGIDYEAFKTVSSAEIYAVLGGDKNSVVNAARLMIISLSSAVTFVIVIIYMATISLTAVLLNMLSFGIMILIYKIQSDYRVKRAEIDFEAAGVFTSSLKDVVNGFVELKMNNVKSEELYQKKVKTSNGRKTECFKETGANWVKTLVLEQASMFIPLGLMVFISPIFSNMGIADIKQIMIIALMILGPASNLAVFVSGADLANNTLSKIWNIEKQLDAAAGVSAHEDISKSPEAPQFDILKIDMLKYTYPEVNDQTGFTVMVRDFYLKKGETVIIKGGNGSGKTTFMRLVAGLLHPTEGDIFVDETAASALNSADYRALFSVIFSDFHLFDGFYGVKVDEKELNYWINKLKLTGPFKDYAKTGVLPTESLSSGQKKRTALLAAILENRQVLLLDEVAADFDQEFRILYYREIIPELKASGRTLLLVSHDDRYFDLADRVVEFREGTNV